MSEDKTADPRVIAIIGTGLIGCSWAALMAATGRRVLIHDTRPDAGQAVPTSAPPRIAAMRTTRRRFAERGLPIVAHVGQQFGRIDPEHVADKRDMKRQIIRRIVNPFMSSTEAPKPQLRTGEIMNGLRPEQAAARVSHQAPPSSGKPPQTAA